MQILDACGLCEVGLKGLLTNKHRIFSYDPSKNDEFECDFCEKHLKKTPAVSIELKPQPEIKFPGCTYYRTLINSRGLQVRINEAVYVERLINDDYKALLKTMHEECAAPSKKARKESRDEVRNAFRIN
jgi:hypothetical protein